MVKFCKDKDIHAFSLNKTFLKKKLSWKHFGFGGIMSADFCEFVIF